MRKPIFQSIRAFFPICVAVLVFGSCASAPGGGTDKKAELEHRIARMNALRDTLGGSAWTAPNELGYYLKLYGMPERADAAARFLERDGRRLFVLRLTPPEVRGRALVVHGYMSHSGHFGALARLLSDEGYEVWMLDLPGFGLSDGDRNGIDDFHSYGDAVDEVVRAMAAAETPADRADGLRPSALPTVAVGHSTGCAALTDLALRHPADAAYLERLVLAAPLVRTTAWSLKRFSAKITGDKPFAFPRVPIVGKGTIANPEFLRFIMDEDPLFFPVYDASWIKAADRWNEFIGTGKSAEWKGRVLLFQGDADDVVDFDYNIPVLSRVFPGAKLRKLSSYSHTILNEAPERLEPILREIADFLKQ
ncbi:MAG: alpha/beta hydrolase [Treponemataceae bacterium]